MFSKDYPRHNQQGCSRQGCRSWRCGFKSFWLNCPTATLGKWSKIASCKKKRMEEAPFFCMILLMEMEEILHQFIGSCFTLFTRFYTSQVVSRILPSTVPCFQTSGKASCQLLLPAACWWPWCHALTSRRTWSFLMPPRHAFFFFQQPSGGCGLVRQLKLENRRKNMKTWETKSGLVRMVHNDLATVFQKNLQI